MPPLQPLPELATLAGDSGGLHMLFLGALASAVLLYIVGGIMDKHERAKRAKYWDQFE